jgi:hypothetical protein
LALAIAIIMTPAPPIIAQPEREWLSGFSVRLASRLIAAAMLPLMIALCAKV